MPLFSSLPEPPPLPADAICAPIREATNVVSADKHHFPRNARRAMDRKSAAHFIIMSITFAVRKFPFLWSCGWFGACAKSQSEDCEMSHIFRIAKYYTV
jgi:hypothetical protein